MNTDRTGGSGASALARPAGERTAAFLAEVAEDLSQGVLSPRVFSDPDVYELEIERIFSRCWVYVGHVTEIPDAGDYVLRYIGRDQFILSRDESGGINLLLNNCMHRATRICHAEKGNTSHFRCPYHGWIYRNNGDWNGAPQRRRAYGDKLDPRQWGLRRAPHVDTYQGLIFANLDPAAISLADYLGDMRWYLDVTFGLSQAGMRTVGDPHRWQVPANWKSGAENFAADAYHVPNLHRSGEETGTFPNIAAALNRQFHIAINGGHGMVANTGFLPEPWKYGGWAPEVAEIFDLGKLPPDQRAFVESGTCLTVATIFPNLSIIRVPAVLDPNSTPPILFTAIRQWQPLAPGLTEIWSWPMEWAAAPAEFNRLSYDTGVGSFGPSGVFEQDDTVAWMGPVQAGDSHFGRRAGMKLNYQLGEGGKDGFGINHEWQYPGTATTTVYDEFNQRRFYQRWQQEVAGQ
jgi:nitrite reductase/ring-hydroxylating ferredoxin subunit